MAEQAKYITCSDCGGRGYLEEMGGLVQRRCRTCGGLRFLKVEEPIEGIGRTDTDTGERDTGEPEKQEKRKVGRPARK